MRLCYSLLMFMALLMLISGASLVAGCGKKGPLYHPAEGQHTADEAAAKKPRQPTDSQP